MKRREMVEIIEKEIRAQNGGTCHINGDILLGVIEAAGMLPPNPTCYQTNNTEEPKNMNDIIINGQYRIEFEWESEETLEYAQKFDPRDFGVEPKPKKRRLPFGFSM